MRGRGRWRGEDGKAKGGKRGEKNTLQWLRIAPERLQRCVCVCVCVFVCGGRERERERGVLYHK